MNDPAEELSLFLQRHDRLLVLTGAGMSTASGIPGYRDREGIRKGRAPIEGPQFRGSEAVRRRYWARSMIGWPVVSKARPNAGHLSVARLEARGRLAGLVTQNVDGLHQAAGSRRVIELHGTLREAACPECRWAGPISVVTEALDRDELPVCPQCASRVKPNVVLFEEVLPEAAYREAEAACRRADVLLVVGSSLQVTPAAWLPEVARHAGAAIVIVNDEPTPLDPTAQAVLHGRAGAILPSLAAQVLGT